MLAIGYTWQELDNIVKSMVFKDYLQVSADSILNIFKTKGLDNCNKLAEFIKSLIHNKTGNGDLTFNQLKTKYKKTLQISATNLTTFEFDIFNYITQPNLPIYIAIKASIAMPFIFQPVVIENNVYCDGGVIDNLPVDQAIKINDIICADDDDHTAGENTENKGSINCIDTILNVFLMNQYTTVNNTNISTISLAHYFDIIMQAINNGHVIHKYKGKFSKNTLVFEIPCDIMTFIKLNASNEDVNNVIQIAYDISKHKIGQS